VCSMANSVIKPCTKNSYISAGLCKYEVHENDVEFPPAKLEWDALPDADKERCPHPPLLHHSPAAAVVL